MNITMSTQLKQVTRYLSHSTYIAGDYSRYYPISVFETEEEEIFWYGHEAVVEIYIK